MKRKRAEESQQQRENWLRAQMTEEPTMAEETAEEAAQRVHAKGLAANRESKKRKRAEESQQQCENRLASQRDF